MSINAWLCVLFVLSYGVTVGQQTAQFIPVAVTDQAPIQPAGQSAYIPLQQTSPLINAAPAAAPVQSALIPMQQTSPYVIAAPAPAPPPPHPGISAQYIPGNPAPAYTPAPAPSDPMHTGGVALNLVVNAGPGPAPVSSYSSGPGPMQQQPQQQQQQQQLQQQQQQPQQQQVVALSPIVNGALPANSPMGANTGPDRHQAQDHASLPNHIVIDGHEYKLNDGEDLVVLDKGKGKHNDDDDDRSRRRHDEDDDRDHRGKHDDDDDDRPRHKGHDDDGDDDKHRKKTSDDKPKKKETPKVPKLPELPSTPNIPTVPTLQPVVQATLQPTKDPIHPGQDPQPSSPSALPEADPIHPGQDAQPSALPPTEPPTADATKPIATKTADPADVRPTDPPAPDKPSDDPPAALPPTSAPSVVEQASDPAVPVVKSTTDDVEVVRAQAETTPGDTVKALPSSEPTGAADPNNPAITAPVVEVATLAPLSLPQSPGQWASPLPKDDRFEIAKAKVAERPNLSVPGVAAKPIARPGQMPEMPNMPPGMESFHRRPDAVKQGPPMPPVPKPMMPKPKAKPGPVNSSSVDVRPRPAPEPVPAKEAKEQAVPVIVVPETSAVIVDTPAPVSTSPAPTSDPAKKTKWAFGHGPEYNYEPSNGRKPADQTNGDPFGNKQQAENDKKKVEGKKKTDDDDGSKKPTAKPDGKPPGPTTTPPEQNKAVTDMFSNIMGKIKF